VLLDPRWLQIRQTLVSTLRKHPAAAADIAHALREIEAEGTAEIASAGKPQVMIETQVAA
jgi:hypothetical protein